MRNVYLVYKRLQDEQEELVGIYTDRGTAEYAINGRYLEYRISRMPVRAQDRRL